MKEHRVVLIEAEDWALYDEIYTLPDKFGTARAKIVGFLVEDEKDYVSVAFEDFSTATRGRVRHVISLPRKNIFSMKTVKVARKSDGRKV